MGRALQPAAAGWAAAEAAAARGLRHAAPPWRAPGRGLAGGGGRGDRGSTCSSHGTSGIARAESHLLIWCRRQTQPCKHGSCGSRVREICSPFWRGCRGGGCGSGTRQGHAQWSCRRCRSTSGLCRACCTRRPLAGREPTLATGAEPPTAVGCSASACCRRRCCRRRYFQKAVSLTCREGCGCATNTNAAQCAQAEVASAAWASAAGK